MNERYTATYVYLFRCFVSAVLLLLSEQQNKITIILITFITY